MSLHAVDKYLTVDKIETDGTGVDRGGDRLTFRERIRERIRFEDGISWKIVQSQEGGRGRDVSGSVEGRGKLSPVLEPMFLERETAKGVLASKTNSYPQQPLSAVFFADNLLLAAWFTTRVLEDVGRRTGWAGRLEKIKEEKEEEERRRGGKPFLGSINIYSWPRHAA